MNTFEAVVSGPSIRSFRTDVVAANEDLAAAILMRDISGCAAVQINGITWEKDPRTGGARRVGDSRITLA